MSPNHAASSITVSETEQLTTGADATPINATTMRSMVEKSVGFVGQPVHSSSRSGRDSPRAETTSPEPPMD